VVFSALANNFCDFNIGMRPNAPRGTNLGAIFLGNVGLDLATFSFF
jgi:hypothetical protein